jgi:hypothetical protein
MSHQGRVQANKAGLERPILIEFAEIADEYERRANYCLLQVRSGLPETKRLWQAFGQELQARAADTRGLRGVKARLVPTIFPTRDL